MQYKKITDLGFNIDDFVSCSQEKNSSGGIIYKITEDLFPVEQGPNPTSKRKIMKWVPKPQFESLRWPNFYARKTVAEGFSEELATGKYVEDTESVIKTGVFDKNGKKMAVCRLYGAIRITPWFSFYPTQKGAKPSGKNNTILIYYSNVQKYIKRIDLVDICSKYSELGVLINQVVKQNS